MDDLRGMDDHLGMDDPLADSQDQVDLRRCQTFASFLKEKQEALTFS